MYDSDKPTDSLLKEERLPPKATVKDRVIGALCFVFLGGMFGWIPGLILGLVFFFLWQYLPPKPKASIKSRVIGGVFFAVFGLISGGLFLFVADGIIFVIILSLIYEGGINDISGAVRSVIPGAIAGAYASALSGILFGLTEKTTKGKKSAAMLASGWAIIGGLGGFFLWSFGAVWALTEPPWWESIPVIGAGAVIGALGGVLTAAIFYFFRNSSYLKKLVRLSNEEYLASWHFKER